MDDYLRIPMRAVPKKRPVVTRNGTFMPKPYVAAKEQFADELKAQGVVTEQYAGNVEISVVFDTDEFWVKLEPVDEEKPKHMRQSDIDNVCGFVLDALQDAGVIKNDAQVVKLEARYNQGEK